MKLLVRELADFADWFLLGLQLDISYARLEGIQRKHSDPAMQKMEMLNTWLKQDSYASWEKLALALRSMNCGTQAEQILNGHVGKPLGEECKIGFHDHL